ncbi:MAG: hypothetical protein RIG84_18210 [Roseovarius sp.]
MMATRILDGLERSTATGEDAHMMARLGFLEWAFTLEGEATPAEARAALEVPEAQRAESCAAQAFVGFLREASRHVVLAGRRGGRRGRLH